MSREPSDGPGITRGILWLVLGALVAIGTYTLATADTSTLLMNGLLVVGLYFAVLGVEKMVSGYIRGRRSEDPRIQRAATRDAGVCLAVVLVVGVAGSTAYSQRTAYWEAARAVAGGNEATAKLQAIATQQTATLQADPYSREALEGWRSASERGLLLRDDFTAAREGARYLSEAASGTVKDQAQFDIQYYGLCLEWMDLFAEVQRTFQQESMDRPPPHWHEMQDDIVLRIRALPQPATRGP